MIGNKRLNFLKNDWKPYPSFSPSAKYWGRLKKISSSGEIEIFSYHEDHFFTAKVILIPEVQEIEFWQQVLLPGDIIAINHHLELTLLTPYLAAKKEPEFISSQKWQLLELWSQYLQAIREFFKQKKFAELSTPLLVSHPGSEPTLDPFKVQLKKGTQVIDKYLPTSPELNLKKALTTGVPQVFEITKSFRNNESSDRHCPEFWILEWYRNFSDLEVIKKDVQDLVLFLQERLTLWLKEKGLDIPQMRVPAAFRSLNFSQVFKQHYDFDFTPTTTLSELEQFCLKNSVKYAGIHNIEDLFSVITFEKIENQLQTSEIIFLEKYPPYAAALARKDTQGWAERFEVYWQGLELANAFFELNDVHEQYQRFLADNEAKKRNGLEEIPLDEDFLYHLSMGLPPCAGIALGLERLFMALFQIKDIKELKL